MYKKKNRLPVILAVVSVGLVILILVLANRLAGEKDPVRETEGMTETESELQTELARHEVIVYPGGAASIEYDAGDLKQNNSTDIRLEIRTEELVTLLVTPDEGKVLEGVDIVDFDFNPIKFMQGATGEKIRINFLMPDKDVIVNFHFADIVAAEKERTAAPQTETEPETETEPAIEETPYGLTLHGLTADIITSYNGQFDDQAFLQELGDALHIDSARSEYRDVTDVTFSAERYAGAPADDKVYHYVYFNNDPERKVLSTYYLQDHAYLFTEVAPETEAAAAPADMQGNTAGTASGANGMSGGGHAYSGNSSYGFSSGGYTGTTGNTGGAMREVTTTTTFDILQVSTTFLAYVGGEESFYQGAFDYILSKGLTGEIVGTMGEYEIDPEQETASFKVVLNTGGSITGTYKKKDNTFDFSGL